MTAEVKYSVQKSSLQDVASHLRETDLLHSPALSSRVDLDEYARKLFECAVLFEAWRGARLVGLVACYLDSGQNTGFITNVSVTEELLRRGVSSRLMATCIDNARDRGFSEIRLQVRSDNDRAIRLYGKYRFEEMQQDKNKEMLTMRLRLRNQDE